MKPLKYRDLARMLANAGFHASQGKGDHEKWTHPLLARPVIITQTREISPGVSRNALKAIDEVKGQPDDRTS
ncbi:MAG: type II toxin-antitoxin system HicA family toxin [Microbacteriaceae bacterium]